MTAPGTRPGEQEAIQAVVNPDWRTGAAYVSGVVANAYPAIAAAVRRATLDEAEAVIEDVPSTLDMQDYVEGVYAARDAVRALRVRREAPK